MTEPELSPASAAKLPQVVDTMEQVGPRKALVTGRKLAQLLSVPRVVSSVSILVVLLVWQGVADLHTVSPIILPSPITVASSLISYVRGPQFGIDIATSGQEFVLGYALACVVGTTAGLLAGYFRVVESVLSPWLNLFIAIPIVALAPLMLVWLGVGLVSKVAVVFLSGLFPVIVSSMSGMKNIDAQLNRMARSFCVPSRMYLTAVALPSCVPYILAGMRLGIGYGLIGTFVAELLGASHGVGAMITNAGDSLNTPMLMAGLVIFASSGLILTAALLGLERRFRGWRAV